MRVGFTFGGVLAVAGLGLAGVLAWAAYRRGGTLLSAAGAAVDQAMATVRQTVNNATSAPASGGDPARAALYGREGYTGEDASGQTPTEAGWLATEEGRRYSYEQNRARAERGLPPVVQSNNGAAFGIFPSPGRRTAKVASNPGYAEVVPRAEPDDDMGELARMMQRWRAGNPGAASGAITTDPYTGRW